MAAVHAQSKGLKEEAGRAEVDATSTTGQSRSMRAVRIERKNERIVHFTLLTAFPTSPLTRTYFTQVQAQALAAQLVNHSRGVHVNPAH